MLINCRLNCWRSVLCPHHYLDKETLRSLVTLVRSLKRAIPISTTSMVRASRQVKADWRPIVSWSTDLLRLPETYTPTSEVKSWIRKITPLSSTNSLPPYRGHFTAKTTNRYLEEGSPYHVVSPFDVISDHTNMSRD